MLRSNAAVQVLVQECIRYNKLIDIMEQSLPELQKALKGLVVMSGELEAVGKAIALNTVPESWEAKVNPSGLRVATRGFARTTLLFIREGWVLQRPLYIALP